MQGGINTYSCADLNRSNAPIPTAVLHLSVYSMQIRSLDAFSDYEGASNESSEKVRDVARIVLGVEFCFLHLESLLARGISGRICRQYVLLELAAQAGQL